MRSMLTVLAVVSICLADAGDVIKIIPAPAGNPDGLVWIGGSLWITSDVTHMIYKIDPADGAVQDSIAGVGGDALTGLTFDGTYLWSCSPPSIYKRSLPGGTVVATIPSPSTTASEGLAWIGSHLWNANSSNDVVYELDPATGTILSYFIPSSADGTLGLTYDGTYMWASFIGSSMIYAMIPGDPVPVSFFLAPTDNAQDMAWDGQYLWLTEYVANGAHVYQIDPGLIGLAPSSWGAVKASF